MTEQEQYKTFKEKNPYKFLLMRTWGEAVTCLYEDYAILLRLIEEKKLDKERFAIMTEEYGYPMVTFGLHYLSEVTRVLEHNRYETEFVDCREKNEDILKGFTWDMIEPKKKPQWVQLELFQW